jgi:hypothetical protein
MNGCEAGTPLLSSPSFIGVLADLLERATRHRSYGEDTWMSNQYWALALISLIRLNADKTEFRNSGGMLRGGAAYMGVIFRGCY